VRSLARCSRTSVARSSVWLASFFSAMLLGTSYTFGHSILAVSATESCELAGLRTSENASTRHFGE
jgi:hypothetical protein